MRLADARAAYTDYSSKTSDIVRQLGFAGIAVIWLFRDEVPDRVIVDRPLLWAGIFIIAALTFDLLHYVAGAIIWGSYHRRKELAGCSEDDEFEAPPVLNYPTLVFFWGKVALIAIAYGFLAASLVDRIGA
jgi:hypothetical protein